MTFSIVPIDHEAWPFVGFFGLSAIAGAALAPGAAAAGATLAVGSAAFFRDPERKPLGEGALSPADGTVTDVSHLEHDADYGGACWRVSIYLSLFDVHVNRFPVEAVVTKVTPKPGRFRPAWHKKAVSENENTLISADSPYGRILVRQIAGVLARRVVCRVKPGQRLTRGERIGLIRFGSGAQAYLPASAVPRVAPGDKVMGGKTVIAELR